LKIKTKGKQCHASMPEKGINAFRAATLLGYKLGELYSKFNTKSIFSPPLFQRLSQQKRNPMYQMLTQYQEQVFFILIAGFFQTIKQRMF